MSELDLQAKCPACQKHTPAYTVTYFDDGDAEVFVRFECAHCGLRYEEITEVREIPDQQAERLAALEAALTGAVRILEAIPPHGRVSATDAAIEIARQALEARRE